MEYAVKGSQGLESKYGRDKKVYNDSQAKVYNDRCTILDLGPCGPGGSPFQTLSS